MYRTKAMFFAFIGETIEQQDKILKIHNDYECWNLRKFSFNEFIEELKRKIPPVNNNVLRNYNIPGKLFERVSWGLFIPNTLEEGGFSYNETLFVLNLYSPTFLYPEFYANDMGIELQSHEQNPDYYFHTQNSVIFQKKEFVVFYETIAEQAKYGSWHFDRIQGWDKEDWRLFVASSLYSGLRDYENIKSPFGWQRESAEMTTILEALFTADDSKNEEVIYRLCKRMAVLLSKQFLNIEKDIKKELYKARSEFVHGSYFLQIAKDSPAAHNNIPMPDFSMLIKHKEYVRFALVGCIYLAKIIKANDIKGAKSVMDVLEQAIIDVELRNKLNMEVEKIFTLMPKLN